MARARAVLSLGLMSAGALLPGLVRCEASGSGTGRSVLGASVICGFMPGSEMVGRLSCSSFSGLLVVFLSKLERKLEPTKPGSVELLLEAPEPTPLAGGVPKELGRGVVGIVGVVLRIAGVLPGTVAPGLMKGVVVPGPIVPVAGGGIVVEGVRMLLKPRVPG